MDTGEVQTCLEDNKSDINKAWVSGFFTVETTELNVIEWYEGCCYSIIKMVLGCLTLFPHTECNIEVIPYYQERPLADKSNNLKKLLLAEIFDFADRHCVRQRKSMVQNIKLRPRGTTCK